MVAIRIDTLNMQVSAIKIWPKVICMGKEAATYSQTQPNCTQAMAKDSCCLCKLIHCVDENIVKYITSSKGMKSENGMRDTEFV